MGFLLFLIARFLLLPLTVINYFTVGETKGYFRDTALSLDIFGNREYRASLNKYLITSKGYRFGQQGETISSVLGKNELTKTLTRQGRLLVRILNKIDRNHCFNSIDNNFKQ